jgi:hypothetical protein
MKSRSLVCLVLGGLLLASSAGPASASLIANLTNGLNVFQDNSVSYITDSAGAPIGSTTPIAVGDVIQGVVNLSQNNTTIAKVSGELDIVFAFQISSIGAEISGSPYSQLPVVVTADGTALTKSLTGAQYAPLSASSAFAIVSNSASGNVTQNPVATTYSLLNSSFALDAYGNLSGGTSNFIQAFLADVNGTGSFTSGAVAGLIGTTTLVGNEAGAFTVVSNTPGLSFAPLAPVTTLFNSSSGSGGSLIHADGTFTSNLQPPTTAQALDGWEVSDQSYVTLDAVIPIPEPASIIVWSFLVAGVGFLGIRLRRQRKGQETV